MTQDTAKEAQASAIKFTPLFGSPVELLNAAAMQRQTEILKNNPGLYTSVLRVPVQQSGPVCTPAGVGDIRHQRALDLHPELAHTDVFRIGEFTYGLEGPALTVRRGDEPPKLLASYTARQIKQRGLLDLKALWMLGEQFGVMSCERYLRLINPGKQERPVTQLYVSKNGPQQDPAVTLRYHKVFVEVSAEGAYKVSCTELLLDLDGTLLPDVTHMQALWQQPAPQGLPKRPEKLRCNADHFLLHLLRNWINVTAQKYTRIVSAANILFPELSGIERPQLFIRNGTLLTRKITQQITRGFTSQGRKALLADLGINQQLPATVATEKEWKHWELVIWKYAGIVQNVRRRLGRDVTEQFLELFRAWLSSEPAYTEASGTKAQEVMVTLLDAHTEYLNDILLSIKTKSVGRNQMQMLTDARGLIASLIGEPLCTKEFPITELTLTAQIEHELIKVAHSKNRTFEQLMSEECEARNVSVTQRTSQFEQMPSHWEVNVRSGKLEVAFEVASGNEELEAESAALHHCVRGNNYVRGAVTGLRAIVMARLVTLTGLEPLFTVEVDTQLKTVVQARGSRNRALEPDEQAIMHAWSQHTGIKWTGDQSFGDVGGTLGSSGERRSAQITAFTGQTQESRTTSVSNEGRLFAEAQTAALKRYAHAIGVDEAELNRRNGAAVAHLQRIDAAILKIIRSVKPVHAAVGAEDSRFTDQGRAQILRGGVWLQDGDPLWATSTLRLKDSPYGPVLSGSAFQATLRNGKLFSRQTRQSGFRITRGNTRFIEEGVGLGLGWITNSHYTSLSTLNPHFKAAVDKLSDLIRGAGLPTNEDLLIHHDLEFLTDLRPGRLPSSEAERTKLRDAWTQRKAELNIHAAEDGTLIGRSGALRVQSDQYLHTSFIQNRILRRSAELIRPRFTDKNLKEMRSMASHVDCLPAGIVEEYFRKYELMTESMRRVFGHVNRQLQKQYEEARLNGSFETLMALSLEAQHELFADQLLTLNTFFSGVDREQEHELRGHLLFVIGHPKGQPSATLAEPSPELRTAAQPLRVAL